MTGQQVSPHTTTGAVQVLDMLIKKRISKSPKKKSKPQKQTQKIKKASGTHNKWCVSVNVSVCERESEIKVLSVCQIAANFSAFFFIFL